jgi:hypothetical protein
MWGIRLDKRQRLNPGFSVDDVIPATTSVPSESLADHVARRFKRNVLLLPDPAKPVVNTLLDSAPSKFPSRRTRLTPTELPVNRCHPLIDAVGTAFSQHRPLKLSPDSIWLVIEQGFAHHVAENAETLRPRLVRHQGSRELTTILPELSLRAFEFAISNISQQIRAATDPVLHETLICDFSTSTPAVRTASEVVLMDCYSSYFEYAMMCVCGIPRIRLLGSQDDWQRIRARVEMLATFGLEWWVARLRPILDELIGTAAGNIDLKFWQAIYKPKQAYGTQTVTGWVADLFPYLNDALGRCRNHVFRYERRDWAIPVESGVKTGIMFDDPGAEKGVAPKLFPSGLSSVRVNLKFPTGQESDIDLVAGFIAVEEDPEDLALSPVISWSATERAPEKAVMVW